MKEMKQALRREYRKKRDAMPDEVRQTAGRRISERVMELEPVQRAEKVFLYAACKSEVPTKLLFEELRAKGKKVAFPKVKGPDLEFYTVEAWDELLPGYQGILEPQNKHLQKEVIPSKDDVLLLPGLVFHSSGDRIGYGGGFYDRYIEKIEKSSEGRPTYIGLCFSLQLHPERLPMEKQDCSVDYIVTELYHKET